MMVNTWYSGSISFFYTSGYLPDLYVVEINYNSMQLGNCFAFPSLDREYVVLSLCETYTVKSKLFTNESLNEGFRAADTKCYIAMFKGWKP